MELYTHYHTRTYLVYLVHIGMYIPCEVRAVTEHIQNILIHLVRTSVLLAHSVYTENSLLEF